MTSPTPIEALDPASSPAVAAELVRLQRASYAVEAALIGDDRIPPLHEDADTLVAAGLRWWAEPQDGRIVGAIGVRDGTGGEADLDRLVVDPAHLRRGIGARLVRHLLACHTRVVVSTGRANAPARSLYEREGFVHQGDREVLPGLWSATTHGSARATEPSGWHRLLYVQRNPPARTIRPTRCVRSSPAPAAPAGRGTPSAAPPATAGWRRRAAR